MFELGVNIHNGEAAQSELIVYAEVEPLDGFRCMCRRGAGGTRGAFFYLCVEK